MTSVDKIVDLSLRSVVERSQRSVVGQPTSSRRSERPIIRDDFVIPHVGPKISDELVVDFAESIANSILGSPGTAVHAQANQNEDDVITLTD